MASIHPRIEHADGWGIGRWLNCPGLEIIGPLLLIDGSLFEEELGG